MKIAVIHGDWSELDQIKTKLLARYPHADVRCVQNVGDFLLEAESYTDADAIVLERDLPLLRPRPDHTEWFDRLFARYPEMATDWKAKEGGERLVRHLRANGYAGTIIFHTEDSRYLLPADLRQDRKVLHCYPTLNIPLLEIPSQNRVAHA